MLNVRVRDCVSTSSKFIVCLCTNSTVSLREIELVQFFRYIQSMILFLVHFLIFLSKYEFICDHCYKKCLFEISVLLVRLLSLIIYFVLSRF